MTRDPGRRWDAHDLRFSGLSGPEGMAFDVPATSTSPTPDQRVRGRVRSRPGGGTPTTLFRRRASNNPTSLAFDAAGNLYVANFNGKPGRPGPAQSAEAVPTTYAGGLNGPDRPGSSTLRHGNLYVVQLKRQYA